MSIILLEIQKKFLILKPNSFFKNSFFHSVIIEWNKFDPSLQRCNSYNFFKSNILKLIHLLLIRSSITIILSKSNMLHKFDLDLVICEGINSNTAFRLHSILYVTVVIRSVIKENTAHLIATCQNNILLLWCAIPNHTPRYYGMW